MKSLTIAGTADPVLVKTKERLTTAFLASRVPVQMACGGKGLCATCHVYVESGSDCLTPVTPREQVALQMLSMRRPNSRLACQAKVFGDGAKVSLPSGLYVVASNDLDLLVGRRAEVPVLHPVDGRTLVEVGLIITRSRIAELRSVDVDVAEMQARSKTVS